MLTSLRTWARRLRQDVEVLRFAARDQRMPFAAKLTAAVMAAHALSRIGLIPRLYSRASASSTIC